MSAASWKCDECAIKDWRGLFAFCGQSRCRFPCRAQQQRRFTAVDNVGEFPWGRIWMRSALSFLLPDNAESMQVPGRDHAGLTPTLSAQGRALPSSNTTARPGTDTLLSDAMPPSAGDGMQIQGLVPNFGSHFLVHLLVNVTPRWSLCVQILGLRPAAS